VVVRKEFADIFDRGSYAIFVKGIPTDSLVYSETEFALLARDPTSFLAQNLPAAIELKGRPGVPFMAGRVGSSLQPTAGQ
jgi:hypothetical protein